MHTEDNGLKKEIERSCLPLLLSSEPLSVLVFL